MRPVSLRTSALMLTLIMVLMPMTPFAEQAFDSKDSYSEEVVEELDEQIVMSTGNTGNADSIAFGKQSGCAIGASGNIKCWGDGSEGQLGLGNTQNIGDSADETGTNLPFVNLGTNASIDKIVMGEDHSCALFTNGSVKCWGESSVLGLGYSSSNGGFGDGYLETGDTLPFLQFPTGRHATMIEAGKSHTCAVMDNNDLICWGDNSKGQLGLGNTDKRGDTITEVGGNFISTVLPSGRTVDSMALGWDHTCVVWDNYSVSCWGGNDHGQLGLDSTTDIGDNASEMGDNLDFIDLPGTASAITAGDGFTCAIIDDSGTDRAFCWGLNDFGQLGIESTTNVGDGSGVSMSSISNAGLNYEVQAIDAGEDHVCAIVKLSSYRPVQCWGNGADGRLGYGSQDSRGTGPGSTSGMGSNLGYVRFTSSTSGYYEVTDIEVGAGTACVIMDNSYNDIICWGDNGIGQLGYGDTEDRGDGQTDLPFTTELNLQLDEEVMDHTCDILAAPVHKNGFDKRLDSDSSDTGDLISMAEIPTTGCPAIAYYDSGSGNIKFAAYDNGMWSVETLGSDSNIADVDIVFDSEGNPHIVHMRDNSADRITYTSKINGIWNEQVLTGLYALNDFSLTIDSNDVLHLYSGKNNLRNYQCSSNCISASSWSQVSSTPIEQTLKDMDTTIDSNDDVHGVYVNQSGTYYFDESNNFAKISSHTTDGSSGVNMRVGIDSAPDGSLHVSSTNYTTSEVYYSYCSSNCDSATSWATQLVTNDTTSQATIQVDADGTPWILLTHNTLGAMIYNLNDGAWDGQVISAWPGAADSFGMMINSAGYVFTSLHLVNPGELWAVTNPAIAGAGLHVDADGDGWTGMQEIACGTNRMVSSSAPSDFDEDGHCDSMDTVNNLPAVGDSSILTLSELFACAILENEEIECWGNNQFGKLGGSGPGKSWPTGFEAVDIDAGENHACALSSAGEIMCWGRNNMGQVGVGTISSSEDPTVLTLPNNHKAADLAVGANHNCVTTTTSQIYCWGDGEDSQTGEYYVSDPSAGYDDDFEAASIASDWTLEGSVGQFGTQWALDTTDASSGTNSFKSSGHASTSEVGFSITRMFTNGNVSFDYKTDTCPSLSGCGDKLSFSIDGVEINSSKGQMSNWASFNSSITAGMHTLRWSFIKDGSSSNDAMGDYVAVDNIQIRTGFRIESGGVIDSPEIMNLNPGGLTDSIVAGERHTCVTNHLDEVWCMGYNGGSSKMVLGNSSTTATNSSALVKLDIGFGTDSVRSITAGYDTSCAILDNSTQAVCWGQRDTWADSSGLTRSGALLLGSSSPSNSGTVVDLGTAGDRIYSIAMGENHACAIVENTIECWGVEEDGSFGQGNSGTAAYSTPQTISVPSGLTAKEIVIEHSTDATCGLFGNTTGASSVICWGDAGTIGYTQQGTSNPVTTITDSPVEDSNGDEIIPSDDSLSPYDIVDLQSGDSHTCALSRQGLIKCWGSNSNTQLSIPLTSTHLGDNINEMGVNLPYIDLGANVTATQLSVGKHHNCVIVQSSVDVSMNGKVMCWGYNDYRQSLYYGSAANHEPIPKVVTAFGNDVSKVVAANHVTCALVDGEIYCMGRNSQRAVSSTSSSPGYGLATALQYSTSGKFVDLYASSKSDGAVCATSVSGAIKCWGMGQYISSSSSNPPVFYDFNGILSSDLSFGYNFACMVVSATTELHETTSPPTNVGDIVCWGAADYGKLGTGSTSYIGANNDIVNAKPINFNGTQMSDVESGNDHSCSISISGEVYCWGRGSYGRLGYGNSDNLGDQSSELPFLNAVDLQGNAQLLALTAQSSCAVMDDNEVYCWGRGYRGTTGHENTDDIGDQSNEMGVNLAPTDLHMRPTDFDLDGTIDAWDTDDDNDGFLDVDDDFRLDPCAVLDTDGDGMPDSIFAACSTNLVEDMDDDGDNWNDTVEGTCLSNSKDSTSIPKDLDSDGICDYVDTDDDGDGWSDAEEQACERKEWGTRTLVGTSTSNNQAYMYNYGTGIVFLPNKYGYQYQMLGLTDSNRQIKIFGFSQSNIESNLNSPAFSGEIQSAITGQVGFDYESYGQGAYVVDGSTLYYIEFSSTIQNYIYNQRDIIYSFDLSHDDQHHDLSIAPDGTVYMTTHDKIVSVSQGGQVTDIAYPSGVNNTTSYAANKQIAVDSNGDVHLLAFHDVANRIYTWVYDTNSNSWNSGLDSGSGSITDVQPGRSSFTVDSNSQPHVAFMKGSHSTDSNSFVTYAYYDNSGSNWITRFTDQTPSGWSGVSLELDSNSNVHLAWVDNTNKTLYHTTLSSSSNAQSTTEIIKHTAGSYWQNSHQSLELVIGAGDDPWISWNPYSRNFNQFNKLAYYGSPVDYSTVSATYPGDHDGDGTCDMLEVATLDYGTNSLIFEMEMDISYIPEHPAMIPTSVSISPSLPAGLTLDTTTGEISGRVTTSDFAGTTYTISTTSGVEAWSDSITIKSTMENPLYIGHIPTHSTDASHKMYTKTAFATNGEIVTLERYTSGSSIMIDGNAAGGNHDGDDMVLSMRDPTGDDYLWAKSIRGNGFFIGDVDVDNNGNIYALFRATASSNDPVEFNFDGVTIDNNGKKTVILAKWDYYGNLQWAINTESTGSSSTDIALIEDNQDHTVSEMDLDKSTGDVVIVAKARTANDDLKFGGMPVGPFGTCLQSSQPWIAKVNTNGQVQWTSVGKSDPTNCQATTEHQVVLHHDGSVTVAGHTPTSSAWDYDFGSFSVAYSGGTYDSHASSWIAHADSSGNWLWAENVTTNRVNSHSFKHFFTMDKFSDDTLFFAYVGHREWCMDLEFAGSSSGSLPTDNYIYCLHVATMNHTTSDVISLETQIGYSSDYDTYRSEDIYSAVDSNDIAHVLIHMDRHGHHDLRSHGFDKNLNEAYDVVSNNYGNDHITDFGLDNSESIYITGYLGGYLMSRTASLLSQCGSDNPSCSGVSNWESGQNGLYAYQHRIYRFWGDYDHEINYNSPSEGVTFALDMIGYYDLDIGSIDFNDSDGNFGNTALPCGLSMNYNTGTISGTPYIGCPDVANETYTVTVNYGDLTKAWNRSQSFEITFGISPALPVVSYSSADLVQVYTRGTAITPIAPTGITNPANLNHFTTYPPLPAGLQVNSTGHIIGTPTANQSTSTFKVKSCNSWNVCTPGVAFTITINEPAPVISYAKSEYEFFKDVPITPVVPTSTGGIPSSWEISPALPTGLSLRGDGAIVGIPFVDSPATNYTIYANNSGGTGTEMIEITVNGTGVFINYPYNNAELAQYTPMMALYPSTSGAAVVSWSIEPTLPSGIFFGTNNGTIWGTPSTLTESTVYTINATGVEDYGIATVTISVLVDTDLDGEPDINDDDKDGDGWSNLDETNCETDEMDENDYPSDIDQDRTCDLLDTSDDRAIIVIYLADSIELAFNSTMNPLVPITAGGDITSWEISPALPLGLEFNGTMPGRSTSYTGTISGTPTELIDNELYTIWANNSNSGQSGSFQITLSVLEDTDGDGIPDDYDDDIDNDGWSNEMENLCNEDPLDATSTPSDNDNDGICDFIDSDDDNDGFSDIEEYDCGSNQTDKDSKPIDDDNDGICDALQSDRDGDGWADGPESSCGSDPDDESSVPSDYDGDKICDSQDNDRDGDGVGNNIDDFPDDRSATKDTDGDGDPDSMSGTSTSDPPLKEDYNDDNDYWPDYDEILCGTDPLDENDYPTDSDQDGTCDALEDDTDGDGTVDADDAFPFDKNEWLDTDGDGTGNNADLDDDGDEWTDEDEERCGSDPLDNSSIPANLDDDGGCISVQENSKDSDDDSSSSTMLWLAICCLLLLLLLLIPLMYWSKERGDSLLVLFGMRNGPEPEHTTSNPGFVSGSGTKNDPFVLKPAHVENFGDSVESKETITISNLDPESLIMITDMAAHTNRGRFNMDPILVEGNAGDKGKGSIVFQLQFDDNVTEDDVSGVYQGQIRVGSASVYINWEVKVGDPEADELAAADRRAKELKAQEDAERKAIEESEAKDKAEKEAAEEKAAAEAKAEKEAADAKEKAEKEAAEEKAKAEIAAADAKAKAEKEATEKKLKEAEDKAAAAEAKAAAAEEKAAAEKKAKEEAEDAARAAAEKAAQERLEQMEKEMEERRKKLEEMDEATRKKEEELLRISEKAKNIDFTTLGVAARSVASKPVEKGATEVSIGDTSDFNESGSAWVQDDEGGMNISWTGKTATALTGVKGLKRGFAAAATVTASDDLQRIKGVGPFIEDKLNALGIYTFDQVGNMTSEIEEQVNIAIEFFPGRIKRDKWAKQAKKFAKEK